MKVTKAFRDKNMKLHFLDKMISESELEFLIKGYQKELQLRESDPETKVSEVNSLHALVCFLSYWAQIKREKALELVHMEEK